MIENGVLIAGANDAVTTSYADVWKQNIVRTNPAAAVVLGVSSGNANDTSAGTGARTVRVTGLDANYNLLQETVTLNGQTKVVTVGTYLRVNKVEVLTAGTGGVNAGELYVYDTSDTVTAGVPQTSTKIFGRIAAGLNITQMACYTTAANERLLLTRVLGQLGDLTTTVKYGKIRVKVQKFGELAKFFTLAQVSSAGGTHALEMENGIVEVPEKSDVSFQAIASAAGEAIVWAWFKKI
jgi:hypothetical protein